MANKYNFLPDFSMFDTADQNDATTEDTSSSLMTRSSKADADPAASREEFLKSFYDNLRSSFETEDMFRKTFPSRKRPKPNQSEIEDYISRSTRAKGIDDALFEATGMYKAGTPSDAGMMSLEDAPDGITVPKQPEIQVEELSSAGSTGSIGEYLRTRKNKGSSFVGEGVEVAGTSKLTTAQVDLAKRLAAKRRMEADAAKMGLPVVDMEEEERKALEYAKTIPKLSTLRGVGIMSPKKEESEVEAAEETTSVVDPKVETAEETDSFATIIKAGVSETINTTVPLSAGFTSLTGAEGTDIHLDSRGFVTLPFGIVPDKGSVKKSDGTTFDPSGKHGLTKADLSGVDYSGATKFGVSRADYDNDEAFAKAVYAEFGKQTAAKYGEGFDDLTDNAKQAAYDMAWNAGIGSANWDSVKSMLQEASKEDTKSKDTLIEFTTNFRAGTDYPRGLLKRRLQTYNLVANEDEKASLITTTAAMKDGKRTGTLYVIKDANGTTLKTWTKPDTDEKLGDLEITT